MMAVYDMSMVVKSNDVLDENIKLRQINWSNSGSIGVDYIDDAEICLKDC